MNDTEFSDIKRNDPCWCGSGKKYKKCHMKADLTSTPPKPKPQKLPKIHRNKQFIKGMEASCRLAKATLDFIEKRLKPGITTNDINRWVHDYTIQHGAIPAPLNYNGFPKSVCTSLNEVICHGIPSDRLLKNGDIINVDVTCNLNGYYGDTNQTYYIGDCSEEAVKIVEVAKKCLEIGIEAVRPYGRIGDIGAAIQKYAHAQSCSVVEQFVGHGIGRKFHCEPQVPHFGIKGTGPKIIPGMYFTIEPMINIGKKGVIILKDNWTAITEDKKLSAQFEHTLFVTEGDVKVLTR
jgi:methionyl aminopeptidase